MAVNSYSLEQLCFVWEIYKPYNNLIHESPVFSFDGTKWKFLLKVQWIDPLQMVLWTIKIDKVDFKKDSHKFQVQVHVESKTAKFHSLGITSVKFPCKRDQLVLDRTNASLRSSCADVEWDECTKFIFTIFNSIEFLDDLVLKGKPQFDIPDVSPNVLTVPESTKEHKLVQTPTSLNSFSCLDSLSNDLLKLMEKDSQYDGKLRCGDCILPIHRLIFRARSEVLRGMLESGMLEDHTGSIRIDDIEYPVLKHFRRYLYSGTLPELTTDLAVKLYETGKKYAVHSLKERCSKFLMECLERNNACTILTIAVALNDTNLREGAIAFILEEEIYQEAEGWNLFCNKQPKLAIEILNRAVRKIKIFQTEAVK